LDWSKIKTIFIVTFLILNIYLFSEFYKIYNEADQIDYMSETSLENKLKTEEIKYGELPKNIKKGRYVSATPKKFAKDELEKIASTTLKGQAITIKNETTIESILDEPIELKKDFSPEDLTGILRNNIYKGDQYRFWNISMIDQTITYYQQLQEKILYKNINGELTFYFNENNEIIGYKQTFLENFEEFSEDENILQPMKAIETLYENGKLPFGSEISAVEMGYYTLVQLTSSQVLTPVWRFVLNGEEDLFVNAIEGQIIQLNNEDKKIVE
jgi:regulatory protein YycI of two-component signal transduction system YycFG